MTISYFSCGSTFTQFVANFGKCHKYVFLAHRLFQYCIYGGSSKFITMLHRVGVSWSPHLYYVIHNIRQSPTWSQCIPPLCGNVHSCGHGRSLQIHLSANIQFNPYSSYSMNFRKIGHNSIFLDWLLITRTHWNHHNPNAFLVSSQ